MKSMLIIKKLQVCNANAISGLTWGFPGITQFMGFSHALSRFLQEQVGVGLAGCGVICHQTKHKTQQNAYGRHSFSLTRNPLTRKGTTAPFNEEGKMHMTVSLVIEGDFYGDDIDLGTGSDTGDREILSAMLIDKINTMRLAGGQIEACEAVQFYFSDSHIEHGIFRRALRQLIPGFALVDQSELLKPHFDELKQEIPNASMLDAWLDFAALKYIPGKTEPATGALSNAEQQAFDEDVGWERVPKPGTGYLVPLCIGYKAISPTYFKGEVKNARDPNTPARFAESAYGVGQWISPHRIKTPTQLLWSYQQQNDWYLCRNSYQPEIESIDNTH